MNFLNQPYKSKLCAQTCLAMILDKTVDEVCDELNKYWVTDLTNDTIPYLEANGYKTTLVTSNHLTYDEIPNNSLVRLCYPSGNGHLIVKYNDRYYDPEVGIIEKLIGHFRITHYITYEKKEG